MWTSLRALSSAVVLGLGAAALVTVGAPVPAAHAGFAPTLPSTANRQVQAVRDVDGDGVRDLVTSGFGARGDRSWAQVTMRSGRTGKALWGRHLYGEVGATVYPVADLGPDHVPGVIAFRFVQPIEDDETSYPTSARVAAYSDRGDLLWRYRLDGAVDDEGSASGVVRSLGVVSTSAGTGLLLSVADLGGGAVRARPVLLDAADGAAHTLGASVVSSGGAELEPVPGWDRPGTAGLVVVQTVAGVDEATVTRRDIASGATEWSATVPSSTSSFPEVVPVGDVVGDPTPDVAVVVQTDQAGAAPTSTLLDGATGAAAWSASGSAFALGTPVRAVGLLGASGTTARGGNGSTLWSSALGGYVTDAGTVLGDGAFAPILHKPASGVPVLVDPRTGAARWRPTRSLTLGAPLTGDGDDLVRTERVGRGASRRTRVTGLDGATGRALWRRTLPDFSTGGHAHAFGLGGGRRVIVLGDPSRLLVLDARTGRVRWRSTGS